MWQKQTIISGQHAQVRTPAGGYPCFYDGLNRLSQALFGNSNSGWAFTQTNTYSVSEIQYDQNGNILHLKRMGYCGTTPCILDNLGYSYIYNGNQVDQIQDAGNKSYGFKDVSYMPEYRYDANGYMTYDVNKGIISITYNHLNLPEIISLTNQPPD